MRKNIFKNIIVLICLFSFIFHAKEHFINTISHTSIGHYCLCDGEKECHICFDHSINYNNHSFDILLIDFSQKKIIEHTTFISTNTDFEYCSSVNKSIYLFNRAFLI